MALTGQQRQAVDAAVAKLAEIDALDVSLGRRRPPERAPVADAIFAFRALVSVAFDRNAAWADFSDRFGRYMVYADAERIKRGR